MTEFGREYADQYDLLYQDKDYEAECDRLTKFFQRFGIAAIETVLDLGCGTGNHALPLARRGYQVTGADRSAEMLAHARRKAQVLPPSSIRSQPTFVQGDVRDLDLGRQFDAVLMMFAVLGYQLTNVDVLNALRTVRRHLKPGGLFVCDVWYGPAVLAIRPSERVKVIPAEDGKLIRVASGALDVYRQLAEVRYQVWRLSGQRVLGESAETHQMRYFFPQELAQFLTQAQLELLDMRAFEDWENAPSENSWNAWGIGRAV